jgi:hypothetical protein
MTFRTLGALRSDLLARLGMGAMGASGGANKSLIDNFLIEAQKELYQLQDWNELRDYKDLTTGIGQNLYDYPIAGTMDTSIGCSLYRRVLRVETNVTGQFVEIRNGITTEMWSTMDTRGQPQRYELFKQIMLYPKADTAYTTRVWFVADLQAFSQDGHAATLDDAMILLHATAHGKAHYRQPDAKVYMDDLEKLLARLRGRAFNNDGVVRRGSDREIERKPAVVGRDV